MRLTTRLFGEINIDEEKMLSFDHGLVGFPDLNKFTLIFDEEGETKKSITWLQSLDEEVFALPVIDPLLVKEDYNPVVDEDILKPLGEIGEEGILVLVTVTVPQDIEKMSVNLKAPILVNVGTRKALQIILDNSDLPVKFPIYELLKAKKEAE